MRGGCADPVVLYVAGSGRSGSTLVERAIGAVPRFCNVGEALDLFRQSLVNDERCGCGEPLSRCPFWQAVAGEAPVLADAARVARMTDIQQRIVRQRHLPRVLLTTEGDFGSDLREYAEGYAEIYRAVASVSGAGRVVDASKWPVQALVLSVGGVDVRVVHVVRDPCGVVYSQGKEGVARPHDPQGATMDRRPVVSAAARWSLTHAQIGLLGRKGLPTSVVQYAHFVTDPAGVVGECLGELGIPVTSGDLGHLGPGRADLPQSHGISGNPSRFRSGEVLLRSDDEWRSELTPRQQHLVRALTGRQFSRLAGARRPATTTRPPGRDMSASIDLDATPSAPSPATKEWPDVSVIVPTRGRPELVRDTLRGIVTQSYPGVLDVVVVHDQEPEDHELAHLGTERRSIRVTSNVHTPGLAGARNTGLDLTSSPLVASCDDDDVWHADKLVRQVSRLMAEPDLSVIGAGIRLMMPDDAVTEWPARSERISRETLLRNRVKELHSSTLVMRREVFAAAGRYDETLPHGYGEDYDWVLRAVAVGEVGCVIEPLADINKRVQSWYTGRSTNTLEALQVFLERHPEITTSRRGHARVLGQMSFVESTMGRRRDALGHAWQGLKAWPATPHVALAYGHIVTGVDPATLLKVARRFGRGLS